MIDWILANWGYLLGILATVLTILGTIYGMYVNFRRQRRIEITERVALETRISSIETKLSERDKDSAQYRRDTNSRIFALESGSKELEKGIAVLDTELKNLKEQIAVGFAEIKQLIKDLKNERTK